MQKYFDGTSAKEAYSRILQGFQQNKNEFAVEESNSDSDDSDSDDEALRIKPSRKKKRPNGRLSQTNSNGSWSRNSSRVSINHSSSILHFHLLILTSLSAGLS